jgi:hypothetical protein
MDRINFDNNLDQIKMEKAKAAANSLNESWAGTKAFGPGTAGSYVDGLQKEIAQASAQGTKISKPTFSVGVLETAMALNNTSFVELHEAKILVEKYIHHASIKGVSEAFLIESMISELENFSWEKHAKSSLVNLKKIYEKNRKEIEVAKAIEDINRSGGRDLFSSIVESMRTWLDTENRVSEKLVNDLKKWSFNPTVRSLVEKFTQLEGSNGKFSINVNSENCEVKSIIAPSLVFENHSVFVTSDRFFKATQRGVSVMERAEASKLPGKFLKAALSLSNPAVRINENGLDMFIGKNKLSVVFESDTETKAVFLNGKRIPEDRLGFILSMELRNSFQSSASIVEQATEVVKAANFLSEIDFGKKIVSKIYEGVEANVFRFGQKVYVHKVNPAMKKNDLFEGNGTQAVNIVKEFLGFDISESMSDILENEDRALAIMRNDKQAIKNNMSIVESEMAKIAKAIQDNPSLTGSQEIKEAQAMLQKESESLKDKWNQINVEIERFEKYAKKVSSVNESDGYQINTDVKIRRNGEKGKVVGVNGNSKTYTVMFENGRTGEYFFNDVVDISDEIENIELKPVNDLGEESIENIEIEGSEANEGLDADMNLAEAPSKSAGGSAKDIDNLGNHNLSEAPNKQAKSAKDPRGVTGNHELASAPEGKSGKDKKFIDKEGNMNLAEAPGTSAGSAPKFIDNLKNHKLSESQKNSHVEKAPKGKSEKPKKFVEDLDDAELAEAPGNHKKNGKKDHEPLNRATLAKAPASKKK